jgi:peptide chain release factor subunit 1
MTLVERPGAEESGVMKDADVSLKALNALAARSFPELALSAYLPTDPGSGRNYYRAVLDDLVKADTHKLSSRERAALRRELPPVLAILEKHRFDCPAVAVFSCRPRGFLRIWRLVDHVPARMAVSGVLDLAPIRLQLFQHPPALAAVTDKHQARLYGLILGEMAEVGQVEGVPIRRHKQGGWSATALQRRQDEHARWHLAGVAAAVATLLSGGGYRRLIVGGPIEARAELKERLAPSALRLLVAEAAVPLYAGGNELAARLRFLDRQTQPV